MGIDVGHYTQKLHQAEQRSRDAMDEVNQTHKKEVSERKEANANTLTNVKKAYTEEDHEKSKDFDARVEVSNKNFKERYDALKNDMLDRMRDMAKKNEEDRLKVREENEREITSITKAYEEVLTVKNKEIEDLKDSHQTQLNHIKRRNDKRVATLVEDFTDRMDDSQKRQRDEIARMQKVKNS